MCFSFASLVLICSMMSLKEGEKSRTVVPLSCRCSDQTTLMMRFAWTLTGSLFTRPQQLFSVVLCSQNAMLHTPPGTRWRRYRGTARTSFKDKCVEGWKRVGEQRSAIDRTERWDFLWLRHLSSTATLTGGWDQDQCWSSSSARRISLLQEAQAAKITTVSFICISCGSTEIKNVRLLPQPAVSASIKVRCLTKCFFTGTSKRFWSGLTVKTGRSETLWDSDSSGQREAELWPHVKDLSSIKHWWWDTWSFTWSCRAVGEEPASRHDASLQPSANTEASEGLVFTQTCTAQRGRRRVW